MDSRKEKYYDYIVDDLMGKTTLVSPPLKIKTPVRYEGDGSNYYASEPFRQEIDYLFNFSINFRPDLRELLLSVYGVNDGEELEMLNVMYKQAMLKKYNG